MGGSKLVSRWGWKFYGEVEVQVKLQWRQVPKRKYILQVAITDYPGGVLSAYPSGPGLWDLRNSSWGGLHSYCLFSSLAVGSSETIDPSKHVVVKLEPRALPSWSRFGKDSSIGQEHMRKKWMWRWSGPTEGHKG